MPVKNPDLLPLFAEVKKLLEPYSRYFTVRHDEPGYYDLWSERDIVIEGRKRKEVFFAGVIIQKNHLGFYYMPVYMDTDLRDVFAPELLALLKGKSCFHIKTLKPPIREQIVGALRAGYQMYRKRGWV